VTNKAAASTVETGKNETKDNKGKSQTSSKAAGDNDQTQVQPKQSSNKKETKKNKLLNEAQFAEIKP
jgi:hypothetical protein